MSRRNPLALVVLAALFERPMYPYELVGVLKERSKEKSVRIQYGSVYTIVDTLARQGMVEPVGTLQQGRRPERTVYALTAAGRGELIDWLSDILRTPKKESPEFEGGLSLVPVLPPDRVLELLKERLVLLTDGIEEMWTAMTEVRSAGLPRLFVLETEYQLALLTAEREFVRRLVTEFESGRFEDLEGWAAWHRAAVSRFATGSFGGDEIRHH